jgi:hypothetical protein
MANYSRSSSLLLLRVWVHLLLLLPGVISAAQSAAHPAVGPIAQLQQQQQLLHQAALAAKQPTTSPQLPPAALPLLGTATRHILQAPSGNGTLQQQEQPPWLPESLLSRGFKGLAPAVLRNWRRLADKLGSPGSNVTVVMFGGSITGEDLQ